MAHCKLQYYFWFIILVSSYFLQSHFTVFYLSQGEWILSGRDGCQSSQFIKLYMYSVNCVNIGTSKDPFVTQLSNFALIFGNELDAEVNLLSGNVILFEKKMF